MDNYINLSLIALLLCCVSLTLVWIYQLKTKNASIVDAWWSYNFILIAGVYCFDGKGNETRLLILFISVLVWAGRLGNHLLIRSSTHKKEDIRYAKLRKEYGTAANFKMWRFFMYQAVSNALLAIPFLLISQNSNPIISIFEIAGVIIILVGVIGESIADKQLSRYKLKSTAKNDVCNTGLWKYSRHPNYFFEWLIWVGFALFSFSSPYGYLAIICPILIYILLNKITGIPMLESLAVKSKGEAYIKYQHTTSSFFPWFPKNAK